MLLLTMYVQLLQHATKTQLRLLGGPAHPKIDCKGKEKEYVYLNLRIGYTLSRRASTVVRALAIFVDNLSIGFALFPFVPSNGRTTVQCYSKYTSSLRMRSSNIRQKSHRFCLVLGACVTKSTVVRNVGFCFCGHLSIVPQVKGVCCLS